MAKGWPGLVTRDDGTRHFACDQPNCYYRLIVTKPEDMQHKCPWIGPTKIGFSVGLSLVEQMWQELDDTIDKIKASGSSPEAVARATAQAEFIAIFMRPFFEDSTAVLKESQRRWKARQDGDTTYETPGLGSRKYDFPTDKKKWLASKDGGFTSNPERADPTKVPVTHNFTPEEVEKFKTFHAGGFTADDLARINGVSVAVMNAALKS